MKSVFVTLLTFCTLVMTLFAASAHGFDGCAQECPPGYVCVPEGVSGMCVPGGHEAELNSQQYKQLVVDMGDGTSALFLKSKKTCTKPAVPCRAAVSGGAAGSKIGYEVLCVSPEESRKTNCGRPMPM
jgi:hypothetical protein